MEHNPKRCAICPAVSSPNLLFDHNFVSNKPFHKDPEGTGYICSDCYSAYRIVKDDYFEKDMKKIEEENWTIIDTEFDEVLMDQLSREREDDVDA